ncbi:hypothetical protein ACVNIS_14610 [Sphaerotilaceae bacterium SBD11-9]
MNVFQRLRWRRKQKHTAVEVMPSMAQHVNLTARLQAAQWLESRKAAALARNPLLVHGRQVYSQNDEDGIIEEIWRRVGGGTPGSFIEFGVGDGMENNTLHLLAQGWQGAWFGGEPIRFQWEGSRLRFHQCWITADNVVSLTQEGLTALRSSQPDLLSLDLDGNDWHLWQAILGAGIKPAVLVAEYNPLLAPPVQWAMPYAADHRWSVDDWYGASLGALHALIQPHGYRLVACNVTGVNAFFVRRDLAEGRFPEVPEDWQALYMPATYFAAYPWFGHVRSVRTIENLIKRSP